MEDLVGNAIDNRALPPCVVVKMRRPNPAVSATAAAPFDYPRFGERGWLARTLHSLQAPSLTTLQIIRSLMRYSTPLKRDAHYKELATFDSAEMERQRAKTIATKRTRSFGGSGRGGVAAIEATSTCAFACSSLSGGGANLYCVFAPEYAGDLDRVLRQTGVADEHDRAVIRNATTASPTERCMMQLKMSRLPGTSEVPVLDEAVHGVRIHQPYDYYHLAARHLAKFFRSLESDEKTG